MDDVEKKVFELEKKINKVLEEKEAEKWEETSNQLKILEHTALFYNNQVAIEKINRLKEEMIKNVPNSIYSNCIRREKIELITDRVERLVQANSFINEYVKDQEILLNNIESTIESTELFMIQTETELDIYRGNARRRMRFLRIIVSLVMLFLLIIFLKIIY
ncbi:hypothetical protein GINT2_000775 [Glugoides intestinalis]